ncbi:MAG: SDR family NAD(P)-dependent oxidoreductase [Gammaproteobacteria bacterium]|nr:SDR family NAD(P)-dependent oxidoreductase [Gammaproteobacteria bacterium]
MKIENNVAVVTGATGGIGLAISEKLVTMGIKAIAIVDLSDQCQIVADRLNSESGREVAYAFQGDVTELTFRESVFTVMQDNFGVVQICIPAAGILRDSIAVKVKRPDSQKANSAEETSTNNSPIKDHTELYPESLFRQVLEVNLMHPTYWAMQTIASIANHRTNNGLGPWQSEEAPQGAVILIGSVSSRGNRGQVSYSAAKAGLNAVSNTLNVEGLYHGVQTKIIHPGFVATPMTDSMPDQYFEEKLKPLVGLGRMIEPAEIANAIVCLIENPIISGQLWADASLRPMI